MNSTNAVAAAVPLHFLPPYACAPRTDDPAAAAGWTGTPGRWPQAAGPADPLRKPHGELTGRHDAADAVRGSRQGRKR